MKHLYFSVHRFLPVLFLLSCSLLSYSQQQNAAFAWGGGFTGNASMWSYGNVVDAAGNSYTAGYFTGTADFDPGTNTATLTALGTDGFITKLDAAGHYVWTIQFSTTAADAVNDIALDPQGNIYVVGYGGTDLDFDPGPDVVTQSGGSFLVKYDPNGNPVWVNRSASGSQIDVDDNGNTYLAGHTIRGTIREPQLYKNDFYVSRINRNGVLSWTKLLSGNNEDISWSVASDRNGNVIAGGFTLSDTLDLDPGAGVQNVVKGGVGLGFLLKLDSSGNFLWGGGSGPEAYDLKTDASNNIFLTGAFNKAFDFDFGPGTYWVTPPNGALNVFIGKLDPNGTPLWVKQLAGDPQASSYGRALAVDAGGNVYTSGAIYGRFDMDPGPDTAFVTGITVGGAFVSKLDANGNYVFGKTFGGTEMAQSYGIGIDAAQNVYTSGFFSGTIDLDPTAGIAAVTAPAGMRNLFINKLIPIIESSLPLTWLSIEGKLNSSQQATINWTTAEVNVQGYTVEKSTDGRSFNPIGSVTAKGDGTNSYTFTEETPLLQTAWYRILQTDIDGSFSHSTIVRIAGSNTRSSVTVYPIPAREQVTISLTGDELLHTKAVLIDQAGRPVKTIILNNQPTLLPLGSLPAGLYFLQLSNGQSIKVLKQE